MKDDFNSLFQLVKRGIKVFLKDKMTVFFSLLAPIIILMLYVLFLGDVQVDAVNNQLSSFNLKSDHVKSFVDCWMIAGVMAVSCITVSFSSNSVMVQDMSKGTINDMLVSPVNKYVLSTSYLIVNFIVSSIICSVVLAISFIYLLITGWYISAGQFFAIIGVMLISVLCSAFISVIISGFIKSESAFGGLIGILSAAIGFLCGAYMPLAMFPKAVQYIALFLPGTYSAGVFRNLFMDGALRELMKDIPYSEVEEALREGFSMDLDYFGKNIGNKEMLIIFAVSLVALLVIFILYTFLKDRIRSKVLLSRKKSGK